MIPPSVRVVRAAGLDVARHFAIAGRYPTWLATPDRWNTWAAAAFVAGLACIRRDKPSLIWATFPIASALVVAMALHKVTKSSADRGPARPDDLRRLARESMDPGDL